MSSFKNAALISATLALGGTSAAAEESVMVVFDGSNSMWGQIDGTAKIEIARGVMDNLLGEWTQDRQVGLMAYGHRRRGDCGDIETLVQPGTDTRASILQRIEGITPTGKTPLTDAVERAAQELAHTDRPATVVLISDGLESCDRDPCALARTLERSGVGFTAHVVGFGLGADQDVSSLSCIAEETGGTYIQAGNAAELEQALSNVSTAVANTPEPTPDPEPQLPQVSVNGPAKAVGGSAVTVTWEPTVAPADYITVVPAGAEEGEYGPYETVRDSESVTLTIPGDPGVYEFRYVHNADDTTLGTAGLEIGAPQVTLSGPGTVLTGADLDVTWQPAINANDYVTIVPAGAEQGSYGSYVTVRDDTQGTLTAPSEPGEYELRYVLEVNDSTVASQPLQVTEPRVTIDGPDTALAGSRFAVSWTGAVHKDDYVTIVPAGTPEGESGNYARVRDRSEVKLQAPADTGLYELRYVLDEGDRTLATATIEITAPEVTIDGPDTALAGSRFAVSWTGAVHKDDYVTIVP
ncbi:vWA domain-containing protein, partial [Roseovarius salis]|uniref:vWA domain-containing protein n=1 Tax=Roseovarius salis TaxID=3376063 RepID=UPI0037C83A66